MDFLQIIIISFQFIFVFTKKYTSSSEESIENLLYYKDCQHKQKTPSTMPPPTPLRLKTQPRQPECPFPKMCCSLSCGNECGGPQSFVSRQMEPLQQNIQPIQPMPPQLPVQPQIVQRGRKKKLKQMKVQPVFGARRDLGFTKEKIKSLISQDEDIRKILKDLVRVTMQKVDLLEMVNSRRSQNGRDLETSNNSNDEDYYE